MNYSEYYDGKKVQGASVEFPFESQGVGVQPLVMEKENTNFKEIPVYYENTEVITFSQCLSMLLIQLVPVIGILILLGCAFGKNEAHFKKTLARSILAFDFIIFTVVALAVMVI